ncbi:uncharacterized protein PRD47_002072 [Ara ararauna]
MGPPAVRQLFLYDAVRDACPSLMTSKFALTFHLCTGCRAFSISSLLSDAKFFLLKRNCLLATLLILQRKEETARENILVRAVAKSRDYLDGLCESDWKLQSIQQSELQNGNTNGASFCMPEDL